MPPRFQVTPFGALLALGLALGVLASYRLMRAAELERATGAPALVAAGFGALGGARCLYVIGSPAEESWLDVLALGAGGLSGYGALFGGVLAGVWVLWRRRAPIWAWLDVAAPGTLLAIGVTRLGCALAGCDYGAPLASGRAHPTQLYESAAALALAVGLLAARRVQRYDGQVFALGVAGHALARLAVEPLRGDPDRGEWPILTLSGWCAIVSVGATLFALWRSRQRAATSI